MHRPVVVLNSGGFDSITLINYSHQFMGDDNIHSLHFLYGAVNEKEQEKCVDKVCEKLGAVNKKIVLPKIDWTRSTFFNGFVENTTEGQYLEYRNLIFLSYALSYAESIGADTVYTALINNPLYKDATVEFVNALNIISNQDKFNGHIFIDAPFIGYDKIVVGHFAKKMGIEQDDFFSCDKPINGKPCGECPDCEAIKKIYSIL